MSEYEGLEAAHEIACFIGGHPGIGSELLSHSGDLEQARRVAKEEYVGCYTSLADYARQLTEETMQIPENLAY